jgi:hypothetical protein
MSSDYLTNAASAIYGLIGKRLKPTRRELALAAARGCESLQELAEDQDFFRELWRFYALRLYYFTEYNEITGAESYETKHFEHVLRVERKILIAGGMNPQFAKALTDQASSLIDEIREGQFTPESLRPTIDLLRRRGCSLADSLRKKALSEQERNQMQEGLMCAAAGIGGAAIAALNATPLAGAVGLSVVGATVSAQLGGALITAAATSAANKLPERPSSLAFNPHHD